MFSLLLSTSEWASSEPRSAEFVGPVQPANEPTPTVIHPGPSAVIETSFYKALNFIYAGQFSSASDKFSELRTFAAAQGYENLPPYSFSLIQAAKRENIDREQQGFLLRWSKELSPRDARVALALSGYPEIIGFSAAFGSWMNFVKYSFRQPILGATVAANILLIGLAALTLAAVVVCLVQILGNAERIFDELGYRLPPVNRGITTPALFAAILILPIFGGLLFALAAWSMLLSASILACRRLALMTSLLIVSWGLAIPVLAIVGENSNAPLIRTYEALSGNSYLPGAVDAFAKPGGAGESPLAHLAYAQALTYEDKLDAAAQGFERAAANLSGVRDAALLNLAVVNYRQQKVQDARNLLEKLEREDKGSFELFYNLALIHLSQLNMAEHRKYYELTRESDSKRLLRVEADQGAHPTLLMSGAPKSELILQLFKVESGAGIGAAAKINSKQNALASALVHGFGAAGIVYLGFAMMIYCGLRRGAPRVARVRAGDGAQTCTLDSKLLIWSLIPGGALFAGSSPCYGMLLLAAFLGCAIGCSGIPFHEFSLIPGEPGSSQVMFWCSAAVFIIGVAISFAHGRKNQAEGI